MASDIRRSARSGAPLEVIELFDELALKVWSRGYTKYSARAILHQIRWFYHIEKGIREFKCNNNWSQTLALNFMARHPSMGKFFEIRIPSPHKKGYGEDDV
jgi:hypothetical protein